MRKTQVALIRGILKGFVEFARIQEKAGVIDGSADPDIFVKAAKSVLDELEPGWNNPEYALKV